MPDPEQYYKDAKRFIGNVISEADASQRLAAILGNADGTLAQWREAKPEEAAEADRLAEAIGFDIPNTDDYCWQASEALTDHLYETAGYGIDRHRVLRITLAGGGPSGWIEFTLDSDDNLEKATVSYCDWFREPITHILNETEAQTAYDRYYVDLLSQVH
jgi:hypothetical protein